MTAAVLLLGELLPGKIAAQWPERVACRVARPLALAARVARPFWRRLPSMLGSRASPASRNAEARPRLSVEEFEVLLRDSVQAGAFDAAESEIFRRVLRFCDRRGRVLMTPRDKVVWIDVSDGPEEIRRKVITAPYSRFPVCDQSLDNLLGIVRVKDLLAQKSGAPTFQLKGLLTLPAFIYEGARGPQILESLRSSAAETAVVLDEYGSVVGLLTLSDILAAVLGELPDRNGEDDSPASVRCGDGSWLLDGRLPLDEFRELFELAGLPGGDIHTVAGLIISHLGHIPRVSESFELLGLRFEVVKMDSQRVERVRVSSLVP